MRSRQLKKGAGSEEPGAGLNDDENDDIDDENDDPAENDHIH